MSAGSLDRPFSWLTAARKQAYKKQLPPTPHPKSLQQSLREGPGATATMRKTTSGHVSVPEPRDDTAPAPETP